MKKLPAFALTVAASLLIAGCAKNTAAPTVIPRRRNQLFKK